MTQNILAKLESKYGFDGAIDAASISDVAVDGGGVVSDVQEPLEDRPVQSWKDSVAVCFLSDFLKEHRGAGFTLYQTQDGYPFLARKPQRLADGGVDPSWLALDEEALYFMGEARADLVRLIRIGDVSVPSLSYVYKQDVCG